MGARLTGALKRAEDSHKLCPGPGKGHRTPSNLGAPLASLPRFQDVLGRIDTLLFANQSLLDAAVAGQTAAQHAGQLKHLVSANAIQAVALAVEAAGNPGLSRRNPLERHYRDVLCSRIHTPQDDVVFGQVGRAALTEVRS